MKQDFSEACWSRVTDTSVHIVRTVHSAAILRMRMLNQVLA
jgi:hypothetical protein